MFGNPLANLVVNILVNSRGFSTQLAGIRGQLNQTASLAARTRSFFMFTAAVYAAQEYIKKLAEIETGFIRIERVAKEFKGAGFREKIFDLASDVSGSSIEDIQKIMKISAQLGVRGRENILEFSRTMAMLSNITGLSADTITTDIGKVLQVFNLLPTDAERVSNTILQVADDFNVVETEITNIVRRIGAFANAIGLSVNETIAFAGAMKDVGVNTEIAASSLYTFFARLQTEPIALGKFFGMANEELFQFFTLLRQNPTEGILKLLERIRSMPPSERLAFFEQLELYGVRNAAALGTLAEKTDRLKEALASANKGAEENIRLLQGQYAEQHSLRGSIDDLSDAWKKFIFEFTNTKPITGFFSLLTNYLNEVTRQLRTIRGLTVTDVDVNNPESIRKRISELDKEIDQKESFIKNGLSPTISDALDKLFGKPSLNSRIYKEEVRRFLVNAFTGLEVATKERKMLMDLYKSMVEPPNKDKNPLDDKIERPTQDAIRLEFNRILERDDEKEKGRSDLFRGFMGLTEAWKNLFLDKNKESEIQTLKDIHHEEVEQNGHLASIDNKLDKLQFGAILG